MTDQPRWQTGQRLLSLFMNLLSARQKVSEAQQLLCSDYPLFANIALGWKVVESPEFDTMATNGPTLFYSAAFVDSLTIEEVEWVLLHEAGHIFLGHHLRLRGVDPSEANEAFDLALNSIIRERCPSAKLRTMILMPSVGKYASLPHGQDAEFYHSALHAPKPEEQPEQQQPEQPEQDDQSSDEGESEEGADAEEGESESEGASEGAPEQSESASAADSEGAQASDSTESGADAQDASEGQPDGSKGASEGKSEEQEASEAAERSPGTLGDVIPADIDSAEEQTAAEAQWKETIAQGIAIAEQCGKLPGWMKDVGESLLGKSEIDWRTILRRFLTKTVPQGSTYSRPSRRHSWRTDFRLPARKSKGGADGAIIVDTSGSIFDTVKAKVLPELDRILNTLSRSSVRMLQIDTRIAADETYTRWDLPLKLDVQGGGGTNLNPAFEELRADNKLRWCVVITDMEWSWRSAPNPRVPTLWIVVNNSGWSDKLPFGELVKVS